MGRVCREVVWSLPWWGRRRGRGWELRLEQCREHAYGEQKRRARIAVTLELLCIVPVAALTINHGYHSLWSPQASRHWWPYARSPQKA